MLSVKTHESATKKQS